MMFIELGCGAMALLKIYFDILPNLGRIVVTDARARAATTRFAMIGR